MVKDNKFAAEPSADSTADAKKDQSETKVTTTENVVQPQAKAEKANAKKDSKEVSNAKESDMYKAHVKGETIQSIAEKHGVSPEFVRVTVEQASREHAEEKGKKD